MRYDGSKVVVPTAAGQAPQLVLTRATAAQLRTGGEGRLRAATSFSWRLAFAAAGVQASLYGACAWWSLRAADAREELVVSAAVLTCTPDEACFLRLADGAAPPADEPVAAPFPAIAFPPAPSAAAGALAAGSMAAAPGLPVAVPCQAAAGPVTPPATALQPSFAVCGSGPVTLAVPGPGASLPADEPDPVFWEDVRAAIAREVRYPRADRRLGREGRVELALHLDDAGRLMSATTVSATSASFARSALEAVTRAAPFAFATNAPAGELRATVPIRFELANEQANARGNEP